MKALSCSKCYKVLGKIDEEGVLDLKEPICLSGRDFFFPGLIQILGSKKYPAPWYTAKCRSCTSFSKGNTNPAETLYESS